MNNYLFSWVRVLLTVQNNTPYFVQLYQGELWLLALVSLIFWMWLHAYTELKIQDAKRRKKTGYYGSLENKSYVRGYKRKDGKYVKAHYRNKNTTKYLK